MARSDTIRLPDVEVNFFGLEAPAYRMQNEGWRFDQIEWSGPTREDPFRERRYVTVRHETGISAFGSYEEDRLYDSVVSDWHRVRSDRRPVMVNIHRCSAKASDLHFYGLKPQYIRAQPMDLHPGFGEMPTTPRFTLADLFPAERGEEIIVEPQTVSSLLEQIKKLQAPELARIREDNRRREAREITHRVVESARIITLAAA